MIINKGYKYKLKPTKQQRDKFEQTASCCRFVCNYFLHLNNCIYEHERYKKLKFSLWSYKRMC